MFNFDLVGELNIRPHRSGSHGCVQRRQVAGVGWRLPFALPLMPRPRAFSSVYQVEPLNWCSLWLLCR